MLDNNGEIGEPSGAPCPRVVATSLFRTPERSQALISFKINLSLIRFCTTFNNLQCGIELK